MPLTSTIVAVSKVPDRQKEAMFALHRRYFCKLTHETFLRDMNEKDWVIVLRDADAVVGFSTLQIIRITVDGTERVFLFSGDTIVDSAHRQRSTLAGSFGHVMLRLMAECRARPVYWFLISKGYRTYRFLPLYFNRFYPACTWETPAGHARLLRAAAREKFGEAFDDTAGLVRRGDQGDRLRPEMCRIPAGRRKDPHVRFFLDKNPNFHMGDELACIADVREDNLNAYAWRAIERAPAVWDE